MLSNSTNCEDTTQPIHLDVVYDDYPPFGEVINSVWEGYSVDVLAFIAKVMNLTYVIRPEPVNDFKALISADPDVIGTYWGAVHPTRSLAATPSTPYFTMNFNVLTRKSELESPTFFDSLWTFITPFDGSLWLALAAVMVTSCVGLSLIEYGPPKSAFCQGGAASLFGLVRSFRPLALGGMRLLTGEVFPKTPAGAGIRLSLRMLMFFVVSGYTANLAAVFTIGLSQPQQSITGPASFQDLGKKLCIPTLSTADMIWRLDPIKIPYPGTPYYALWSNETERANIPQSEYWKRVFEAIVEGECDGWAWGTTDRTRVTSALADDSQAAQDARKAFCQLELVGQPFGTNFGSFFVPLSQDNAARRTCILARLNAGIARYLKDYRRVKRYETMHFKEIQCNNAEGVSLQESGSLTVIHYCGVMFFHGCAIVLLIVVTCMRRAHKPKKELGPLAKRVGSSWTREPPAAIKNAMFDAGAGFSRFQKYCSPLEIDELWDVGGRSAVEKFLEYYFRATFADARLQAQLSRTTIRQCIAYEMLLKWLEDERSHSKEQPETRDAKESEGGNPPQIVADTSAFREPPSLGSEVRAQTATEGNEDKGKQLTTI